MRIASLFAAGVVVLHGCSSSAERVPDSAAAAAPLVEREVSYAEAGTTLAGFVAAPGDTSRKRPGVLVVHEWWGHNEHARQQARRLAEAGYVGFALDMYGDGRNTTHPDTANAFMMQAVQDQPRMVARFRAALEELRKDPRVDPTQVAAIGYCFGGMVVLSMARAGEPLAAVGSFHGAIPQEMAVDSGMVKARILIMTGGADPMVPTAQVDAFAAAMRKSGAMVEVVTYPDAQHGFTNPRADSTGVPGLHYDATIDAQSWATLRKMLGEVFR
jgi:dienelactone hydrolase